jgi:hypothetical protein
VWHALTGTAPRVSVPSTELPLAGRELPFEPSDIVPELSDGPLDRGHLRSNLLPGESADFVFQGCGKSLHRHTCFVLGTSYFVLRTYLPT